MNIFLFCEPLRARRWTAVTTQRTKVDWAHQIKDLVDRRYPDAERIVLVLDNLNTHTPAALYEAFSPQDAKRLADKLEIHHTPKHGSWLNIAEIELSALSRQCLDRRVPDVATLQAEIEAWQAHRDRTATVVHCRFTTADARIKLKRLSPSIEESQRTKAEASWQRTGLERPPAITLRGALAAVRLPCAFKRKRNFRWPAPLWAARRF